MVLKAENDTDADSEAAVRRPAMLRAIRRQAFSWRARARRGLSSELRAQISGEKPGRPLRRGGGEFLSNVEDKQAVLGSACRSTCGSETLLTALRGI